MRNYAIISLIALLLLIFCDNSNENSSVNPLLGDISFENKFGGKPTSTADNTIRIKTHLEFAEGLLRDREISNLSPELKAKRNQLLDLLHEYWTKGLFPKNYDFADQRMPCFIDKDGTICAVGYLIEQTSGRTIANQINSKHKYDKLLAMNDPLVNDWIETSGLTKEECAMIQPTYGPEPVLSYNQITPAYGITSSVISGLNISLNTINGIQIGNGKTNKAVPIIGLITGAGQIVLGSVMFPPASEGWLSNYTNESEKTLSMVNIGLGTTTMILSAWNLIANRKQPEKSTSWNVYGIPLDNSYTAIGFSVKRKF